LPVAPPQVSASRADDTVTIRFTVPTANISGVRPADIERVDVYAWTGPDVPPARVFKLAKVVASVPVRKPPPPQEPDAEGHVPPPPPPVGPGVDQGAVTELRETLAADAFVPIEVTETKKKGSAAPAEHKLTPPDAMPLPPPLARHYVVVGVNHGGSRGPAGPPMAVPLWAPPPPPPRVSANVLETGTELTWTAPEHLRRPILANALPDAVRPPASGRRQAELRPRPEEPRNDQPPEPEEDEDEDEAPRERSPRPLAAQGAASREPLAAPPPGNDESSTVAATGLLPARLAVPAPAVSTGYRVYEVPAHGGKPESPSPSGGSAPPSPKDLTTAPVKGTTFTDKRVEYGVERCYIVRTVETVGTLSVESAASAPVCVKPADVFPPAAPKSLAAVASEGAISLIWEGSDARDLGGYIVLRGTAPGAPTERLTPQPIRETTFRDTTVKAGTRYVYAVIAVDTAKPPNASAPSNQAQETAR
jgi:hypothetical protein